MVEPLDLRRRLRRGDFLRAGRRGRRVATRFFIVLISDRDDRGSTRLGITVTRKVGNAVCRNRIKRVVREWFRQRSYDLGPCDLVVIAKRDFPTRIGLSSISRDLDEALAPSGSS